MEDAFLVQMNEFDHVLESELRRFLDPIVKAPAPMRRASAAPKRELTLLLEKLMAPRAEGLV